jgi:hypothetical protein
MTDLELLLSLRDQINAHLVPAPPVDPPPPPVDSPTGRKPKFWTEGWQRKLNQMRADGEADLTTRDGMWFRLIRTYANQEPDPYGDTGLWAALMYQMTGDVVYVARAWDDIQLMFASELNDDNNGRELLLRRVIIAEIIWPGLSSDGQATLLATFDRWIANLLDSPSLPDSWPLRHIDSDQVTGIYFGVAYYYLAFGSVHPPAAEFFSRPFVGGLDATGRDRTTLRNCVYDYVLMADGGEWIESSEYNLGTVRLLMLGAMCARRASGRDCFPEVTAWAEQAACRYLHMATQNLLDSVQWGDNETVRVLEPWAWVSTAMLFDSPVARKFVDDLITLRGLTGSHAAEPIDSAFLAVNEKTDTAMPTSLVFNAPGQGILVAKAGWGLDDSMFASHFPPTFVPPVGVSPVDHAARYFGNVQIWKNRTWALTNPLGYGPGPLDGRFHNTMLHCGYGTPQEFRGAVRAYDGDGWAYHAATCGGSILQSGTYQPPPKFWHEWSRMTLWLYGDVDTCIVFERSHVDDPVPMPRFSQYSASEEAKLAQNPLRLLRWHAQTLPVIAGNRAEWVTCGGAAVARAEWLDGPQVNVSIGDQAALWSSITQIRAPEKKFHVDIAQADRVGGFQVMATVLQFGDPAQFSEVGYLVDTVRSSRLVMLARPGQQDRVIEFNAMPSAKLPSPGNIGAYDAAVPGLLASVRIRGGSSPLSIAGARVWQMETASGVAAS